MTDGLRVSSGVVRSAAQRAGFPTISHQAPVDTRERLGNVEIVLPRPTRRPRTGWVRGLTRHLAPAYLSRFRSRQFRGIK